MEQGGFSLMAQKNFTDFNEELTNSIIRLFEPLIGSLKPKIPWYQKENNQNWIMLSSLLCGVFVSLSLIFFL